MGQQSGAEPEAGGTVPSDDTQGTVEQPANTNEQQPDLAKIGEPGDYAYYTTAEGQDQTAVIQKVDPKNGVFVVKVVDHEKSTNEQEAYKPGVIGIPFDKINDITSPDGLNYKFERGADSGGNTQSESINLLRPGFMSSNWGRFNEK